MGTLWVVLGIWLVVCGATVGDPVASKSAEALEHYQRGEYDQALQLYRDALLDRPDAPELHFNVGDALFKRGEYDQALREFERVLSAEEKKIQAQAHYNMGNSFFQQQAFEQAVAAYKQALELDAADEDTKVNLELALEKLQEQQEQQEQQDQQDQQDDSEQEQDQHRINKINRNSRTIQSRINRTNSSNKINRINSRIQSKTNSSRNSPPSSSPLVPRKRSSLWMHSRTASWKLSSAGFVPLAKRRQETGEHASDYPASTLGACGIQRCGGDDSV